MRSRGGKDLPIDAGTTGVGGGRPNYATVRHPPPSNRSSEFGYDPPDYEADDSCSYRGSRRKNDIMSAAAATTGRDHRRRTNNNTNNINNSRDHFDMNSKFSKSSRDVYYHHQSTELFDSFADETPPSTCAAAAATAANTASSSGTATKFNFDDEQGFESDFNSPSNGKSQRFPYDTSEKDRVVMRQQIHSQPPQQLLSHGHQSVVERTTPTGCQQKLRFDDKITVAKFDADTADDMFEDDDFSKADFSFDSESQWSASLPRKNNLKISSSSTAAAAVAAANKRHENIKKSESVNIFAKKKDDPFEDDDFFKSTSPDGRKSAGGAVRNGQSSGGGNEQEHNFKWDKNFAKFDENI